MTTDLTPLGPGPERLTNEWLNRLQDRVESNDAILRSLTAGVLWGCEVQFLDADDTLSPPADLRVKVGPGEAISDGVRYIVAGAELDVTGSPGDLVFVFLNRDGEIETTVSDAPTWPDASEAEAGDDIQPHVAVLGLGRIDVDASPEGAWEWGHDIRHFVRERPSGAPLVVGDLDAGADFESLQPALDYLAACDLDDNAVSRRILLTRHQDLTAPLVVRCHGVVIEGQPNAVGAPDADAGEEERRVVLTWSFTDAGAAGATAAMDLGGFSDVTLRGLRFLRQGSDAWCALYRPGDRFRLESCTFGDDALEDAYLEVAVDFGEGTTEGVAVVDNRALGVHRGLFGYTPDAPEPGEPGGFVTGCLRRARVARNRVRTTGPTEPGGGGFGLLYQLCHPACLPLLNVLELGKPDEPSRHFFAIDFGVNPDTDSGALFNVAADNVVEGCYNGIRAGRLSSLRGNRVQGCALFGIVVTGTGSVSATPAAGSADPYGATEVLANHVEHAYGMQAPWWRAGIRLEVTTCYVAGNTVVVGDGGGCGILHGPLDLDDAQAVRAHFAALRPGEHTIAGNHVLMNPVDGAGHVLAEAAVTREGIGIGVLSVGNRVAGNGVFHARTGIVATAGNVICDNVVEPTAVGILAWAVNTVCGNTVGWFPDPAWGLPWDQVTGVSVSLEAYIPDTTPPRAGGAILLATGNVCDGNVVVAGQNAPRGDITPAAVHVSDWASALFGPGWGSHFDSTVWGSLDPLENALAAQLKGRRVGGNEISGCVIQLADPAGTADLASFRLDGVVLEADWAPNALRGCLVWRGRRGISVQSGPADISGSAVWFCASTGITLEEAPGSSVSGCAVLVSGRSAAVVGEGSPDTAVRGCFLLQMQQPGSHSDFVSMYQATNRPPECLVVGADRVRVDDCAIINYGNVAIAWQGSFGACGGCWFHTGDPAPQLDHNITLTRYPAIQFASTGSLDFASPASEYYPQAATQGNLVHGAHMLNCAPIGVAGTVELTPIAYANEYQMYNIDVADITEWNPHPPVYDEIQERWTNRVAVETCFYWHYVFVPG